MGTYGNLLVLLVCFLWFAAAYVALGGSASMAVRASRRIARLFGANGTERPERLKEDGRARRRVDAKRRSVRIAHDMPGFLDIVTLGLSAGLSFDSSLELYCKRCDTDLSHALWDCLLLWRMGAKTRRQALEDIAEELQVPSLTRFTSTVCEALSFGTPLARTLERQSKVIRDEQRSLMEEEIEKVPVKMLIPLGVLIVPAMLLAILGPLLGPAIGMA